MCPQDAAHAEAAEAAEAPEAAEGAEAAEAAEGKAAEKVEATFGVVDVAPLGPEERAGTCGQTSVSHHVSSMADACTCQDAEEIEIIEV